MKLPGEVKLAKFSTEEYEHYGILDELGCIIGVKENAPEEFKKAFEADKKRADELEKLGLYP